MYCWIINVLRHSVNRIQSKVHRIRTYESNEISLSCFDDKICIQSNGCDGLGLGYQSYLNNYFYPKDFLSSILLFFFSRQNSFFIKHIVRLLAWHIKSEKSKALKKDSEELMPITWHPRRWWNFCMSEDEKKKQTNFDWVMLLMHQ